MYTALPEYRDAQNYAFSNGASFRESLDHTGLREYEPEFVEIDISDRLLPIEEVSIATKTISVETTVEQSVPVVQTTEEVKELTVREEVEALYPGVFVDTDFERFSGTSQSLEHKTWLERGCILRKVFEEIELTKSDKPANESKLNELKEQNAKAVASLRPQVQEPIQTAYSNFFPWLVNGNVTNLNPELQEVS